jgi:hypothetical protein
MDFATVEEKLEAGLLEEQKVSAWAVAEQLLPHLPEKS